MHIDSLLANIREVALPQVWVEQAPLHPYPVASLVWRHIRVTEDLSPVVKYGKPSAEELIKLSEKLLLSFAKRIVYESEQPKGDEND